MGDHHAEDLDKFNEAALAAYKLYVVKANLFCESRGSLKDGKE
jgi:hypothetical protein